MTPILLDRISELIFLAIDGLYPIFRTIRPMNPTFIILGFNNVDSESGNYDMIDLTASVFSSEQKTVDNFVFLGIKFF